LSEARQFAEAVVAVPAAAAAAAPAVPATRAPEREAAAAEDVVVAEREVLESHHRLASPHGGLLFACRRDAFLSRLLHRWQQKLPQGLTQHQSQSPLQMLLAAQ